MRSFFFFSSRRRHTRLTCDWSSDVCSSDLGEGEEAKHGSAEGLQMHGRAFTARGLHDRQQVVTAIGGGFRVDDDPARLIAEVFAVERVARFGLSGDVGGKHATLELAEVLHARDHFLSGVAALGEADAAEKLEVRHLRNELVLRRGSY